MPGQSTTLPPGPLPPRPRTNQNEAEEMNNLPYFHGLFSCQEEIADLMVPYLHTDGCFLIRTSSGKGPGNYTLSISHQGGIKHIRMHKTNNTFYLEDRIHFSSVKNLVGCYADTDIPNIEGVHDVRLKYPILKQKNCWLEIPIPSAAEKEELAITLPNNNTVECAETKSHTLPNDNTVERAENKFNSLPPHLPVAIINQRAPIEKPSSESACGGNAIKLPVAPPKKKKKFFSMSDDNDAALAVNPPMMKQMGKKKKMKISSKEQLSSNPSSGNTSPTQKGHSDFHSLRPPLPVPRQNDMLINSKSPSYSVVRDMDTNRTPDLMEQLSIVEKLKSKWCPCGLPLQGSQMPEGWRVHRIKEGAETGKIFYQKGTETAWMLPGDIEEALSDDQKVFIASVQQKGKLGVSGTPDKTSSSRPAATKNGDLFSSSPQPTPAPMAELKQNKLFNKMNNSCGENKQ